MMLKSSTFNLYLETDKGRFIYNTLSKKLVKVDEQTYNLLKKQGDLNKASQYITLCETGIIASDTTEMNKLELEIDEAINSKSLDLTIVMTNACNFRCVYCYQPHNAQHMSQEVEEKIIAFFNKHVGDYKSVSVSWFGGEPLLNRVQIVRLSEMVKYRCKAHNVAYMGDITTNGYNLDLETFEALVKNHIFSYQVTIDGNKEYHDKSRPHLSGFGSFDKIVKNLLDIKKHSITRHWDIIIRMNVNKENIGLVDDFMDFFNKNFGNDKRFHMAIEIVRDWGGNNQIKEQLYELGNSEEVKKKENVITRYNKHGNAIRTLELNDIMCYANKKNGYAIAPDGSIYKCAKAIYEADAAEYRVGYIDYDGRLIVEKDKETKWITPAKLDSDCIDCPMKVMCYAACPLNRVKNGERRCNKYLISQFKIALRNRIDNGDYQM